MNCLIRLFQCKDSQSKKEWLAAYEEARNLQKEAANTKVTLHLLIIGFADPDPVSGAFLTAVYGIRERVFPDPVSPTHISKSLVNMNICWVKSTIILCLTTNCFSRSPFVNVVECGIWDG
jgi:hypothetical protein